MKHSSANITVEGHGWNPNWVAEQGQEAFADHVIEIGAYPRDDEGKPLTEEERRELAAHVFEKATAWVEKHKAKKAEKKTESTPATDAPASNGLQTAVESQIAANTGETENTGNNVENAAEEVGGAQTGTTRGSRKNNA